MSSEAIRVLVVEDDEVSARAVEVMLARLCCAVQIAEDGLKAVESFRHSRYDLVFMRADPRHAPRLNGSQ